ncbi:MAG: hypothetical protein FWD12_05215 [Alphaproteobacteria bacterium]|nr:hypothetical protein [Alphaproteobacteria bacterium]
MIPFQQPDLGAAAEMRRFIQSEERLDRRLARTIEAARGSQSGAGAGGAEGGGGEGGGMRTLTIDTAVRTIARDFETYGLFSEAAVPYALVGMLADEDSQRFLGVLPYVTCPADDRREGEAHSAQWWTFWEHGHFVSHCRLRGIQHEVEVR